MHNKIKALLTLLFVVIIPHFTTTLYYYVVCHLSLGLNLLEIKVCTSQRHGVSPT